MDERGETEIRWGSTSFTYVHDGPILKQRKRSVRLLRTDTSKIMVHLHRTSMVIDSIIGFMFSERVTEFSA